MVLSRGQWGSQVQFLLTLVGYCVGLGNVWRFPYLCYNYGGGAFLVPYCLMLAVIGLPLYFMELSLGQFASLGPVTLWRVCPLFKGLGISMVMITFTSGLYYVTIIAWAFYFLFSSMTSDLPYADCTHEWNTHACITADEAKVLTDNQTAMELELEARNLTSPANFTTPSEEFYYNKVLQLSSGIEDLGSVIWELALCILLCWVIIFLVLINGIGSLGKVVFFVATFPYVMLTAILIRGVTLDGAGVGLEFYMKPEASGLSDLNAWSDAATQILYSLNLAQGGLLAMASYNTFHNNSLRDAVLVPIINCSTSLYAGFAIFSVLGYLAEAKGVPVSTVATGGAGLVFVVYPEALAQMPAPTLWSILFFFMLVMLGFSSEFSIMETVFVALLDEFPHTFRKNRWRPILLRAVGCTACFLFTLLFVTEGGFYLFTIFDEALGAFPLLFCSCLEVLVIHRVYKYNNFACDIELMIGRKPPLFYKICWKYVTATILFSLIIVTCISYSAPTIDDYTFPDWALGLGWVVQLLCMVWIPVYGVYYLLINGVWQIIKQTSRPSDDWGPAEKQLVEDNISVADIDGKIHEHDGQLSIALRF